MKINRRFNIMAKLEPKGLTISIIFEAMSLNYGEGIGNISELKKLSRSGELLSYESRQAIRYDIYRMLVEYFKIKETPLKIQKEDINKKETLQFSLEAKIDVYPEIDLFGYMKTIKGKTAKTRPAVVRITPAISLEPMNLDIEFGTNLNFAQRAKADPNPFQFEHHLSLYSYTVTVDLDRIGKDPNDNISLSPNEKEKRVNMLLNVLKVLNRDIKGRRENQNPLFAIGGIYNVKNPFFMGKLKTEYNRETRKFKINLELLKSVLEMDFNGNFIKDNTYIGYLRGYWENEDEFSTLIDENKVTNINEFFENLKSNVNQYFNGGN
jgi:CRISPR-associated protein Cst2